MVRCLVLFEAVEHACHALGRNGRVSSTVSDLDGHLECGAGQVRSIGRRPGHPFLAQGVVARDTHAGGRCHGVAERRVVHIGDVLAQRFERAAASSRQTSSWKLVTAARFSGRKISPPWPGPSSASPMRVHVPDGCGIQQRAIPEGIGLGEQREASPGELARSIAAHTRKRRLSCRLRRSSPTWRGPRAWCARLASGPRGRPCPIGRGR